jgi:hypothetical protein
LIAAIRASTSDNPALAVVRQIGLPRFQRRNFAFKLPELGTGLVGFALRLAQRFVDGGRSGQVIQRDVDADHGT